MHGQHGHGQPGAHGQPGGFGPGQVGAPAGQAFHPRAGQPHPHQQAAQQSYPGQQGAAGRGPVRPPVVPQQAGPGAGAGRPSRTAEHAAAEDGLPQPGARGQGQGHRSAVERPADEPGAAGRGHGAAAGRMPSPAGQPAAGAGELRGRQARAPQVRPQGGRAAAEGARTTREARTGREGHPVRTGREGEHPDGPGTHDGAEEHQAEATAAAPRSAPPVPAARDRAVG